MNFGDVQVEVGDDVEPVSLEVGVGQHAHLNQKVTGLDFLLRGVAFPRHPEVLAVADALRDLHSFSCLETLNSSALAIGARRQDLLARTVALTAGHLDHHRALPIVDGSLATTGRALRWTGAWLATAARASTAGC